ncbi:hypothetical protein ACFLS9_07010 [Bacteroidota bacterium]
MQLLTEDKIKLHKDFLEKQRVKRPLVGCIKGWEGLSRYVKDTETFFPMGIVTQDDIDCQRFLPMYRDYSMNLDKHHELYLTLEPFPFFPWTEAAIDCPIKYTGKNFWASPVQEMQTGNGLENWIDVIRKDTPQCPDKYKPLIESAGSSVHPNFIPDVSKTWIVKYGEHLDTLIENFSNEYPIGQSILRGPLDMAAALLGAEIMIYNFFEQPGLMKELLSILTNIYLLFVDVQNDRLPQFDGGYIIGSYYIWTPGKCLRHQEDAMALLSPDLYREFVHPYDIKVASAVDYTLFHIHSTGLHHLDILLENDGIHIIQVSKDEGVELNTVLAGLQKIQEAGKCLILKGRLNEDDLKNIKKCLNPCGLCIQAVVLSKHEENIIKSAYL